MNAPKFVVFQGADDLWYVRLQSANGQILMTSEGYTRRASALRAVRYIRRTVAAINRRN